MTGVRRASQKDQPARPDATTRDFTLWEAELKQGLLSRLGAWLLRAFGDVAHRDGFVLVTGGGVCWHCYVPSETPRAAAPAVATPTPRDLTA